MTHRPGDSAPNFDSIEETEPHSFDAVDHEEDTTSPLSDSHVFAGHALVPHQSDGSTDVFKSDDPELNVPEAEGTSEAAFPQGPVVEDVSSLDAGQAVVGHTPLAIADSDVPPSPTSELQSTSHLAGANPDASYASTPAASPREQKSGLPLGFIILLSYASAVTLALIYLFLNRSSDALESLPDPADKEGAVYFYDKSATLPVGHVLHIGESQRYGNIRLEVLGVAREAIEYVHFTGEPQQQQRPPTEPVLCLKLKVSNVSTDQEIAPFDSILVFRQRIQPSTDEVTANIFVAKRDQQATGPYHLMFSHPQDAEWDLAGQQIGKVLKPGESIETFLPATDEANGLEGELIWRFEMRKGYSYNKRGVTTLVDVVFDSDQVNQSAAG